MEEKQKKNFWIKIKAKLIKAKNFCLNLLFPSNFKCLFCNNDVPDFQNMPVCDRCLKDGIFNNGRRCRICDSPIYDEREICDHCSNNRKIISRTICPFLYKGRVRSAILKFKSDNARFYAQPFAKFIAEKIKSENLTIDVIVPVPMHAKTLKKRGYNQAELLADELGKILSVPVDKTSIKKVKPTQSQKTLSYKDRQNNVASSMTIENAKSFANKNVLIVDDIITTCATVNAVASLLKNKAHNVYAAAVARRDVTESPKYKK